MSDNSFDARADLEVVVDPAAFERIVGNLVANAVKHGKPPIVIEVSYRDGGLVVAVEDDGEGIAPNLIPRLFDQFERGTARRRDGAGLGLSIAQAYARAHGGDVAYIERDRPGARFEVTVPLAPPVR